MDNNDLNHEVEKTIKKVISDSIHYFQTFQEIANKKGNGQLKQFKTEGWLQATLAYELHKSFDVVAEYSSNEHWDLAIWKQGEIYKSNPILIEMKCLSASYNSDQQKIEKDVKKILGTRPECSRYYLIILPKSKRQRKAAYAERMKNCLYRSSENRIKPDSFEECILFKNSAEEGICYLLHRF